MGIVRNVHHKRSDAYLSALGLAYTWRRPMTRQEQARDIHANGFILPHLYTSHPVSRRKYRVLRILECCRAHLLFDVVRSDVKPLDIERHETRMRILFSVADHKSTYYAMLQRLEVMIAEYTKQPFQGLETLKARVDAMNQNEGKRP